MNNKIQIEELDVSKISANNEESFILDFEFN